MVDQRTTEAQTWRDLADKLTPAQIVMFESDEELHPEISAAQMLERAQAIVERRPAVYVPNWREFAEQLPSWAISRYLSREQVILRGVGSLAADERADAYRTDFQELYDEVRGFVERETRLAHIPVPEGATADSWDSIRVTDGDAIRTLVWFERDVSPAIGVTVGGWQDEQGDSVRYIGVIAENAELTAVQARELAAALNEAADVLESLR